MFKLHVYAVVAVGTFRQLAAVLSYYILHPVLENAAFLEIIVL